MKNKRKFALNGIKPLSVFRRKTLFYLSQSQRATIRDYYIQVNGTIGTLLPRGRLTKILHDLGCRDKLTKLLGKQLALGISIPRQTVLCGRGNLQTVPPEDKKTDISNYNEARR